MDKATIREKLKTFICTELLKNPDYPLKDDEALFSSGAIDSFAMAQVGVFIETEFNLYVPDPDLTVENMDTLEKMVDRVAMELAKQ